MLAANNVVNAQAVTNELPPPPTCEFTGEVTNLLNDYGNPISGNQDNQGTTYPISHIEIKVESTGRLLIAGDKYFKAFKGCAYFNNKKVKSFISTEEDRQMRVKVGDQISGKLQAEASDKNSSVDLILSSTAVYDLIVNATQRRSGVFYNDLSFGATGSDVIDLQTWLIDRGFDIPSISSGKNSKGYFGRETQAAVIAYQRSVGLPAFGFFGPLTRKLINNSSVDYNGTADVVVVSPNGGEVWTNDSHRMLKWKMSSGSANDNKKIDIYLSRLQPNVVCAKAPCGPFFETNTYVLDKNVPEDFKYNWIVGTDVDNNPIPAGKYGLKVCLAGTNSCDYSDGSFTLKSAGSTDDRGDGSSGEIKGSVKFDKGDCMPIAYNPSDPQTGRSSDYRSYNGTLYFVSVEDNENLQKTSDSSYKSLFPNSLSTTVRNGSYSISKIPLGDYYLMIEEVYKATDNNLISIRTAGEEIVKDLEFFKCTSY